MEQKKRKVIIDTDPGIDDALAIMLALSSPELEVVGLTIVEGNVGPDKGAKNAAKVLKYMGREDIPVYIGSDRPLQIPFKNAEDTHGDDGMGNTNLPDAPEVKIQEGAVDFILDTLRQAEDDEVSLIALGPLTNIAKAVLEDPEAMKKAKELMIMGGSYKSNGNCSPVAEFNVWCDPHAADIVFEQIGIPVTMTGLDVTRKVVLTPNYRTLIRKVGGEIGEMIYQMTQFYEDFHWDAEGTLGVVVNDPLAVAALIDPSLVGGDDYYVSVVTEGPAEGMTMVDPQGILKREPNVRVLTEVNPRGFMEFFLTRLFPESRETITAILDNPVYGAES